MTDSHVPGTVDDAPVKLTDELRGLFSCGTGRMREQVTGAQESIALQAVAELSRRIRLLEGHNTALRRRLAAMEAMLEYETGSDRDTWSAWCDRWVEETARAVRAEEAARATPDPGGEKSGDDATEATPVSQALIEDAIALALASHRGERDRGDAPYIWHPLHVALHVDSPEERVTALLHDVIEDSGVTPEELCARGFPTRIVDALDRLTKRTGEEYDAYILRIRDNELARRVKIADLEHNLDLGRIREPTVEDRERREKYERALALLREAEGDADRGD